MCLLESTKRVKFGADTWTGRQLIYVLSSVRLVRKHHLLKRNQGKYCLLERNNQKVSNAGKKLIESVT